MMDIISSYQNDLRCLRKQHKKIALKYKVEKNKVLGKERQTIDDQRTETEKIDQKIIASMISSTEYALWWLENGHEKPMTKESFQKMNKKKRTQLWGNMDDLIQYRDVKSAELLEWERREREEEKDLEKHEKLIQMKEILSILSTREKDFFCLRYQAILTEEECAEKMNLELGTVKSMAHRIRKKISYYFDNPYQMNIFDLE